jgi:3-methyladenine DNA glycosylase AlkD
MPELKKKGTEQNRKIYARHGMAADRLYGVRIADLKVIAKTIKGQQALACELYESGVMDAMYLAEWWPMALSSVQIDSKNGQNAPAVSR